jgi:hypothetical protein
MIVLLSFKCPPSHVEVRLGVPQFQKKNEIPKMESRTKLKSTAYAHSKHVQGPHKKKKDTRNNA